jgi:hypothetical protein
MPNQYDVANVTELAQWIVDNLNESTWNIKFVAQRYNLRRLKLDAVASDVATVCVWPSQITAAISPRCSVTDDTVIVIQAYRSGAPDDLSTQDDMIKLCEDIRDYFSIAEQENTLPGNVNVYEVLVDSTLDEDVLEEYNLFSSRMSLSYKIKRQVSS